MLGLKVRVEPPTPPFPVVLAYLWAWFCDISAGIAGNGTTPPVITWEAAAAWAISTGINPEPWEYRAMLVLGAMRANIISEGIRRGVESQNQPGRKSHDGKHSR